MLTARRTRVFVVVIRFTSVMLLAGSWSFFGAPTVFTTKRQSTWRIRRPSSWPNGTTSNPLFLSLSPIPVFNPPQTFYFFSILYTAWSCCACRKKNLTNKAVKKTYNFISFFLSETLSKVKEKLKRNVKKKRNETNKCKINAERGVVDRANQSLPPFLSFRLFWQCYVYKFLNYIHILIFHHHLHLGNRLWKFRKVNHVHWCIHIWYVDRQKLTKIFLKRYVALKFVKKKEFTLFSSLTWLQCLSSFHFLFGFNI